MWKESILKVLDKNSVDTIAKKTLALERNHLSHRERVIKAIDWWEIEFPTAEKEAGCEVLFNGVTCLCASMDFMGYPYYHAKFVFQPRISSDDVGSGCGNSHEINF